MAEDKFEEFKENEEPHKIQADYSESKERYSEHKDSGCEPTGSSSSEKDDAIKTPSQPIDIKKKKKKKKRKEYKKELMTAFWKQIKRKASALDPENMSILPIEEYFMNGELTPIFKCGEACLVFRLMQTHFKAKDYDTYKDFTGSKSPIMSSTPIIAEEHKKFYDRRYYLFSKFDQGIKLDEESIFYYILLLYKVGIRLLLKKLLVI